MSSPSCLRLSILTLLVGLPAATAAASAPLPPDILLTASFAYDDNVYGTDSGPLADVGSLVATVVASVSATPAPGLRLAYSANAIRYFEASREDHEKHVFSAAGQYRSGALSWRAATDLSYISGDDDGTDYGPGNGSAFSTIIPRERRRQFQNTTDFRLRLDTGSTFIRAFGHLSAWDMRTKPVAGNNYVDRYDLQGGLDFGRVPRADHGPALHLGYRRGYQSQDRDANPASPRHASNHFDRFVVGYDGRLAPSLALAGEVGWTRHSYSADPAIFAGPAHQGDLFTDLVLTWTASEKNSFHLRTSRSRISSSTGVNTLLLSIHQVNWKHAFDKRWSSVLTIRAMEADYLPAFRDDIVFGFVAALTHAFDDHWRATLSLHADRGRERHPAIRGLASASREFDRNVVSLSISWKR
jgi:hypothetical protein